VLQTGFVRPALRTAFTTFEGLKAVASFLLLLLASVWLVPYRFLAKALSSIVTDREDGGVRAAPEKWIPHRFASRTTILRRTFDDLLFKKKTLGNLPPNRPKLIAVAAELRTGSAFYFTARDAGTYRLGPIDATRIRVAQAVAASAAYPLLLPALDESITCCKPDGSLRVERVTLTDGGVYDNLGLAPFWPDRDSKVSIAVEPVDFIVACRAGYGLRMGDPSAFMPSRMNAAFSCVFNRAQNHATKRLYDLADAKRLTGFVLPYLDQDDRKLACPPGDLVRREAVADYPTNFSAMPPEWIEKLSKRGEQLTLAAIRQHAPWLLPADWGGGTNDPVQPSRSVAPAAQP
jgi:NTE family protein